MKREEIGFKAIETAKKACDSIDGTYEYANGFVIGAEWRINSVWHNASEIPEYGRTILAICKDGRTIICGPNNSDWGETVGIFWIDNWAYIDDLTPKEE